MIIDTHTFNDAVKIIASDKKTAVFLDANILIPPDRRSVGAKNPIKFSFYKETILNPLLNNWDNIALHESVYNELVADEVKTYAEEMVNRDPSRLVVHYNTELAEKEKYLYTSAVDKLSQFSNYLPDIDNSDDRGEILSLAFMSVKNYVYFSANDHLPINLISKAEELGTGLDCMNIIQTYELIYILHIFKLSSDEKLRVIYRYMYYATKKDKRNNPNWHDFLMKMDILYKEITT